MANLRYVDALGALKLVANDGVLAISSDEFDFLTQDKLWLPADRSLARKCIEGAVYGAIDYMGYPRFAVPAEYVAAAIATYVHPVNIRTACTIMDGVDTVENIINGIEEPIRASVLFAFVIQILGGDKTHLEKAERMLSTRLDLKLKEV